MKRVKSLVFKGLAQIACQSQATHLGNAGLEDAAPESLAATLAEVEVVE